MGWIQAGMFRGDEEQSRNEFIAAQKASCRNATVQVGGEYYGGLDVIRAMRHVKVYGGKWDKKTGIVSVGEQEFPVWQDEGWSHWELDPDEFHANELSSKSDFHYKI